MPQNDQTGQWNPRYAAYARAHGREPADQLAADRIQWPGGSMCGFILWNGERIADFARDRPDCFMPGCGRLRLIDHAAYDEWLQAWVAAHA